MTFMQKLENRFLYAMSEMIYSYYIFLEWDEYYSKVLGKRNVHAIKILISKKILISYVKCKYLTMKTYKKVLLRENTSSCCLYVLNEKIIILFLLSLFFL